MDRLRFVVLRHEGITEPHFDVMYERTPGGPLATWRWPLWPSTQRVPITPLRDHRRAYLTFEGPIGDDRGQIARIAEGDCSVEETPDDITLSLNAIGWPYKSLVMQKISEDMWEGWTPQA